MFDRILFVLTVSTLVLCLPAAARAQSSPEPDPGLDSLVAIVLRDNPEIQMARYESSASERRIDPAGTLPDPQLKIAAMNVPTNFTLTSDMMTMAPQVSLMQMLPLFGKLGAAGDVQRYEYQSSQENVSRVSQEVIARLKTAYGAMYAADKTLRSLGEKDRLLQSVVKVAERLFAVGQVPQQDVFRAVADQTMVQSDILMERGVRAGLEAEIGALLGRNAPYAVEIDSLSLPPLDSLADLAARLQQNNPELKQLQSAELTANARAVLARREAFPDLSLGVSYGYRGASMPDGTKALDMMNVEVGVSLPIFFGARQQSMIDEADLMEQAVGRQHASAALSLTSRLRASHAEARAQQEMLRLYSSTLIPQYEATFNASLSSYSVGTTTFAMVIDNLTALINAKIAFVKLQSTYFSTVAGIAQLVGDDSDLSRGVQ